MKFWRVFYWLGSMRTERVMKADTAGEAIAPFEKEGLTVISVTEIEE